MYDDRDYADLRREDVAVYNFRGYTVLRFYKETKELQIGQEGNMCCFCPDDYRLMSKFLDDCYKYTQGEITKIDHVEVN